MTRLGWDVTVVTGSAAELHVCCLSVGDLETPLSPLMQCSTASLNPSFHYSLNFLWKPPVSDQGKCTLWRDHVACEHTDFEPCSPISHPVDTGDDSEFDEPLSVRTKLHIYCEWI